MRLLDIDWKRLDASTRSKLFGQSLKGFLTNMKSAFMLGFEAGKIVSTFPAHRMRHRGDFTILEAFNLEEMSEMGKWEDPSRKKVREKQKGKWR